MKFRLRLRLLPYSWLERLDRFGHRHSPEKKGWNWACNLKDRRLGFQWDDRLLPSWLWKPKPFFTGPAVRVTPRRLRSSLDPKDPE